MPKECNFENSTEGNLIKLLTEKNPNQRPTALEIQNVWLKRWSKEISD